MYDSYVKSNNPLLDCSSMCDNSVKYSQRGANNVWNWIILKSESESHGAEKS